MPDRLRWTPCCLTQRIHPRLPTAALALELRCPPRGVELRPDRSSSVQERTSTPRLPVVAPPRRVRRMGAKGRRHRHGIERALEGLHSPLVCEGSGGGGEILCLHLPELAGRSGHAALERLAERAGRLREGRRF